MGGGAIAGMIASLKNNKRQRVSTFKKLDLYKNVKYKEGRIEKKASRAVLKQIRDKVKRQQRIESQILYFLIGLGILLFIWIMF